jgi:sterol desaturase/sphingolipid hydroxylase (fatty acid hydroxylase superfamily)
MESIQIHGRRGPLRDALARSLVVLVVICPTIAVSWQVSRGLEIGTLSLGIYVAVALLLIASEWLLAFDDHWGSLFRGRLTDFLYAGAASAVERLTFVACVTAVAAAGGWLAGAVGVQLWPGHWAFGFQLAAAMLIADAGMYFRHRLFHRSARLWRFHQIHHSPTGLWWIRSAYTHPLEQLCIMLAMMFPIAFLGAGEVLIAVVAFVYGLSGLLQHANVDARSSFLSFVFATPEIHRIHHRADEIGNSHNYSAFFVLMDHLFGTFCRPDPAGTHMDVGLEGVTDFPGNFLTHMTLPFGPDTIGPGGGPQVLPEPVAALGPKQT